MRDTIPSPDPQAFDKLMRAQAEVLRARDTPPATREIGDIVLLIGATDLGASKRFYVDHGLTVKRSFPGRYAEFDAPQGGIKLALYPGRNGLAKDAGIQAD